jgi:outer membrane protein assembly factor BamB
MSTLFLRSPGSVPGSGVHLDRRRLLAVAALGAVAPASVRADPAALAGRWVGEARLRDSAGAARQSAFEFLIAPRAVPAEAGGGSTWFGHFSLPERFVIDAPFAPVQVDGARLRCGPFDFAYDPSADTLSGTLPRELVPVFEAQVLLRRVAEPPVRPVRPPLAAPLGMPLWRRALDAPLWAALGGDAQTLLCALDDGRVVALDTEQGRPRWTATLGSMLRAQPVVVGSSVFVQADDGHLYRLALHSGAIEWRVRVNGAPIVRLPPSDPKTRYDFRASAVVAAGDTVYLGTHDGAVLALAARDGAQRWQYRCDGPVLAAPALADRRLFVGSYDRRVHAIDAASGAGLWQHDTGAAVSSTPVVAAGRVMVGSRSYEMLALSATDGRVLWSDYLWYSWIESSGALADGTLYFGSSDAAQLSAVDAASGALRWRTDLQALAWGTPAIAGRRLFIGTRVSPSLMPHRQAHAFAIDRDAGAVAWRYPIEAPAEAADSARRRASWGIEASPIVLGGRVFFGTLDGTVLAFNV